MKNNRKYKNIDNQSTSGNTDRSSTVSTNQSAKDFDPKGIVPDVEKQEAAAKTNPGGNLTTIKIKTMRGHDKNIEVDLNSDITVE